MRRPRRNKNLLRKESPVKAGPRIPAWLLAALLVIVTVLAYQPVWHAGFIWDDDKYVTEISRCAASGGWLRSGLTHRHAPVLSAGPHVILDGDHLWGLNPLGYHLVTCCCTRWRRCCFGACWRAATARRVAGGGPFRPAPVRVESVAWVTERKNVLSAVFYFSAALAYCDGLSRWQPPMAGRKKPDIRLRVVCLWPSRCSWPALLSKTVDLFAAGGVAAGDLVAARAHCRRARSGRCCHFSSRARGWVG